MQQIHAKRCNGLGMRFIHPQKIYFVALAEITILSSLYHWTAKRARIELSRSERGRAHNSASDLFIRTGTAAGTGTGKAHNMATDH
jgi:hypothetical protein